MILFCRLVVAKNFSLHRFYTSSFYQSERWISAGKTDCKNCVRVEISLENVFPCKKSTENKVLLFRHTQQNDNVLKTSASQTKSNNKCSGTAAMTTTKCLPDFTIQNIRENHFAYEIIGRITEEGQGGNNNINGDHWMRKWRVYNNTKIFGISQFKLTSENRTHANTKIQKMKIETMQKIKTKMKYIKQSGIAERDGKCTTREQKKT